MDYTLGSKGSSIPKDWVVLLWLGAD